MYFYLRNIQQSLNYLQIAIKNADLNNKKQKSIIKKQLKKIESTLISSTVIGVLLSGLIELFAIGAFSKLAKIQKLYQEKYKEKV